jgi:putative flippase GtrA
LLNKTSTAVALLRWGALGVGAAIVELGLLKALVDALLWPLPMATFVAAEALILVKFALNDRWVFGHTRPTLPRLLRYHGACVGALVVYWLVINGLALVGLMYEIAFLVGTAASFGWSLVTNFLWVWRQPKELAVGEDQHAAAAVGDYE